MIKKPAVFIFLILILGLIATIWIFFTDKNINLKEGPSSTPEPFFCNGQPCNIILIIPETLSARHMGIYGYERDTTPFIDEFFSDESLVFENAWSTAPWTWPSFAALFTSQLASEVFVETWKDRLSDKIPTFIDVLEKNKIPKLAAHTWTFFAHENDSFVRRFEPDELFQGEDTFLFLKAIEWIEEQVQKDGRQPFFLLLQPLASHDPYNPPEPYRYFFDAPSEYPGPVTDKAIGEAEVALQSGKDVRVELDRFRLQYDQEIRYLDSQIENFISQIPEKMRKSTVFIFASDHGEAFGQHNTIGHGKILYEEVIHVPFLIRAPGIKPIRIREPITLLDTGPTILDIFGLEVPNKFQGISLLPLLQNKEPKLEKRILRTEWIFPEQNITREEWEVMEVMARDEEFSAFKYREYATRKQQWKLIQLTDGSLELYNLERDYYEQNNLIPQWHDLSKEEQAEILPLFEELGKSPLL